MSRHSKPFPFPAAGIFPSAVTVETLTQHQASPQQHSGASRVPVWLPSSRVVVSEMPSQVQLSAAAAGPRRVTGPRGQRLLDALERVAENDTGFVSLDYKWVTGEQQKMGICFS